MAGLRCRHRRGRTTCPELPTGHRPVEAVARNRLLFVQSLGPRRAGRRGHPQTLGNRKQAALHPRRHPLRGCLAHPPQPGHLRQNPQLRLQYSAVQSIRHHRPRSLRRRAWRPQIPIRHELLSRALNSPVGLSDHRHQVAGPARGLSRSTPGLIADHSRGGTTMSSVALSAARSSSTVFAPPANTTEKASATACIAVLASMIGAFMAILNIQITNASLLDIEGGIGTGVDNGAWISTSYLIGEIVVIPLTDYLSKVFSFRLYIIANTILFALFSVACAFAHDLPSMLALRGLQGFAGGVLIPMAFTMVLTKLPKAQQPIGLAAFAVAVTFAPAIGPTIGGYLTENYGWQTIFFVNVIPTIVMVGTLSLTLEKQPMQLDLLREGDWLGILTMTIGLSALQTVLEERNKDDWFGSPFIVRLAVIAAVSLTLFVWIELT